MRDPLERFRADVARTRAWIAVAMETMDAVLERVHHASDFAPDLQARMDKDAIAHMALALRDGERLLDRISTMESDIAEILEDEVDEAAANATGRRDNAEAVLRYICQEPEQQSRVREELAALGHDASNLTANEQAIVIAVARGVCSAFLEESA
jgi:hypothetical protein